MPRTELTEKQILAWADAHRKRTGKWPEAKSGRLRGIVDAVDEVWANIDQALRMGFRGLRKGNSIARLLAKHRGKRNRSTLPKYAIRQILRWADEYHAARGRWPRSQSGPIRGAPGETWCAVDIALAHGQRGLPGGSSLTQLLAEHGRVRHPRRQPKLTIRTILRWADSHRQRTGHWPLRWSGVIADSAAGDTWAHIDRCLRRGSRGLPAGTSLHRLLTKHRRVSRHVRKPLLNIPQILEWADAHRARTGRWPKRDSGPIPEAPRETWKTIDVALLSGKRGLPGKLTIVRLLARERSLRTRHCLPKLSEAGILRWARAYRRRHGRWPNRNSGPIPASNGESWQGIDMALKKARRGLKGRSSLAQLLS